tara:strand:+ start:354 stop:794 length:441 start_codon:yes stop_codon:yes gene_type:complete
MFNNKFLYALEAVLDIAINFKGTPIQGHEITKRQGIPKRYLEKILQELVHKNILKGTRGPKGGYSLAREKRKVNLFEIYTVILAIENKFHNTISETEIRKKIISPLILNVSNKIASTLQITTLDDLCKKITNNTNINTKKKIDFSI